MRVYAIRKRGGRWAVCFDDNIVLQFETYAEAVEIARAAAEVMSGRYEAQGQARSTVSLPPQKRQNSRPR